MEKNLIAEYAAKQIESGMSVGLGTGSTANLFIDALARRVRDEGLQIEAVASSMISSIKANECGLTLRAIEQINCLDCYVDGADEVAPDLTLLKGRGADLVREKLLAEASEQFLVLADASKFVTRIGERYPIPVEVMPFAWQLVKANLEEIGARVDLRINPQTGGVFVTSYGSAVLDVVFAESLDASVLNRLLDEIPGVVEHGIFSGLASCIITVTNGAISVLDGSE